jgi:hypothetical protein
MTDRAQSNNLYRYLSQQRADKELYEEQCDDFRDLMDESINNMVERFNYLFTRYDIDRGVLRELILEDIKEQL